MPDFGTSNRVAVRFVEESTWGTTPSTPTLQTLRITGETLNYASEFTESQEIRSDRMTPDTIRVNSSAGGDVNAELSYGSFDALFAGAAFNPWTTTGSDVSAATDIAIDKTTGTPNTYALTSSSTDFSAQSWVVGQIVKVEGFAVAGPFYAEITTIGASSLGIRPFTDVADEAAGDEVDIVAMDFLRNGTTKKSFTIQKGFLDLSTPQFYNFAGARVGSLALNLATGAPVGLTLGGILAKSGAMTPTQFTSATINPASTSQIMNAVGNVASVVFDGDPGATQLYFNSLSFTLDNSLRGQRAIGTDEFIGIEPGSLRLTGSAELYFEDAALFTKFRAATAFSLSLLLQDGAGNVYAVTIPRAKYTAMTIEAGGRDQDIFVTTEFTGIINLAGTHQFQLSRLAAA